MHVPKLRNDDEDPGLPHVAKPMVLGIHSRKRSWHVGRASLSWPCGLWGIITTFDTTL